MLTIAHDARSFPMPAPPGCRMQASEIDRFVGFSLGNAVPLPDHTSKIQCQLP